MKLMHDKRTLLVALVMVLSLAAFTFSTFLTGTLADTPMTIELSDIHKSFLTQPQLTNILYPTMEVNQSFTANISGLHHAALGFRDNNQKATFSFSKLNAQYTLMPLRAGLVSTARGTTGGVATPTTYHVFDNSLVGSYTLYNGGVVVFPSAGTRSLTSVMEVKNGNDQAGAHTQITWETENSSIAEVIDNTIHTYADGITRLEGSFTDKWGEKHTMVLLARV